MDKTIKLKIMLSIAPWDLWEDEEDTHYPVGQAYLGAVLDEAGYETELLNLTNSKWEDVQEEVINKIKQWKPDIFGVSILSNSRTSALKLLKTIKKISPKTKIIAGGIHTTFLYEQVLDNYPVDFVVLGEGDKTILELIKAIEQKKNLSYFKKINGIAYKFKGEIIKSKTRERITNLDSLPIPKHDFFKQFINKSNCAYIMTSRGCPFNCSFCPSSAYWGRRLVQRSAENVFKEIKYLIKKYPNLNFIRFLDDEFICNNQRVIDLCKMILKEDINIKWNCLGRASSMNEELVKWMKKAGCVEITFGIESGSQRILDKMGKKVKISQIINAFELCKKYKIIPSFLAIIGSPGENSESVNETIKLARRLNEAVEPAILIVFPGTDVCRLAEEKGLITKDYWLGEGLCPLYTCEHSKLKLWLWCFKVGLITNFYSTKGSLREFLYRKIVKKINPHNFLRIFKRYISNKV